MLKDSPFSTLHFQHGNPQPMFFLRVFREALCLFLGGGGKPCFPKDETLNLRKEGSHLTKLNDSIKDPASLMFPGLLQNMKGTRCPGRKFGNFRQKGNWVPPTIVGNQSRHVGSRPYGVSHSSPPKWLISLLFPFKPTQRGPLTETHSQMGKHIGDR